MHLLKLRARVAARPALAAARARLLATHAAPPAPGIRSVAPSQAERAAGRLAPRHMQTALEALHEDGIVMLEGVVSHAHLDKLNERMVRDAEYLCSRENSPFNYNRDNIQQDPPPEPGMWFEDIFVNPLAVDVTSALLGGRPKMTFCSGNTALKATESQPVHTDADFAHPKIPFALVVNVGLVDMTPENGSTELWLGTQNMAQPDSQVSLHGDRASGRIREELLARRKAEAPEKGPFQPVVPKGSIVLRDLRLWHCGKPNRTDVPRVMLAMIHFAPWYRNQMRLEFPKGMELLLANPLLDMPADFVDPPVKYLDRAFGNAYDFGQRD
ncbi:hypothetical protein GLOTRDRAFT_64771 [Gloeophyllum trabeum ATCC 11539]|uniref:Phytanoyl-CoA dioxygenase n=1 Tax=Gloeophyllum trabeum (strain ATCC 11539 / FP-39264 / Madison 617) TaxID=670483 RepID=S7RCV6_GLOTA|nr:uncharacterized protein GLOTRDRAFT_64771 [Gloeophyllum trabeum ATCC 11539]EPQ52035.1 hypothetical protein GLOTRDRAFT_64771 [Gloeophyllum trabeum ATCC 11539]